MKDRSPTTGSIKVHNHELTENITVGKGHCQFSKDDFFIPSCRRKESKDGNKITRSQSSYFLNGWLSEKSVKHIQEKIDYECSDISNMYNHLVMSEEQLQHDLNRVIKNDADMKKRKMRLLSKKWYEETYLPLNRKISEEMNGANYRMLDKEKRKQYTSYLNHQNNKEGNVFLDVFEAEEYDPLYLNSQRPGPLKAATAKLADPLLHLQDKRNEEERIVLACDLGETLSDKEIESRRLPALPLIPLGRHGTKCSTWLDMELTDIQSDVRIRSQERRSEIRNKSDPWFKDAEKPVENAHFACNLKWQRKKQFPEEYDTTIKLL